MKRQVARQFRRCLQMPRLPVAALSLHASRCYSTHPPNAKLNLPVEYGSTPLLAHSADAVLKNLEIPAEVRNGATKKLNLFQAVNDALGTALAEDESVVVFGEDVAFGGVFRCTMKLAETHGAERVFNTPLSEQGILGFGIGLAAEGMRPVAEIQFADYVYPAFDQIVNEAAKMRFRDGSNGRGAGGLTVRMPCGGVGHGALYHSQSPESLFTHVPGIRVIMPRSPIQAKGLLLSAIRSNDPCIFMEPKILYRAAVEQVPVASYELPLSKAEVLKEGSNVTVISYGQPLYYCIEAIRQLEAQRPDVSIELIDLRTVHPFDRETVFESVKKTGRVMIVHEAYTTASVGSEVAAAVQENPETFNRLEAPVRRVAGWDIHNSLAFERFHLPDITTNLRLSQQLADVVADIKTLTASSPNLLSQLGPAFQKYNEDQLVTVKLPGSSESVLVSEHNSLGEGRYYDVESSSSFEFDHATQKASAVQSHTFEGAQADLTRSTLKSLSTYISEHFPNAAYGVYPIESDSKIAIVIVANKYSPNNFWNGRWRSVYTFDPSSGSLEGTIKVDVHYYEDGNVRLQTKKPVSVSVASSTGAGIAKEISSTERKYQEELNKGFVSLSEGAFKGLRRQLPVTRQKIEWDKVTGYRLGQDIGGGSSKR
ncbi:hypothetical protein LLEC1_05742 [Akanthomyces lecanii]|uniref:F-actin-capping protein subunit alpha n=1 Tax=Cordyceps confragosa TaxID=2714763 RepID=A0A179I976_CORDF|nr:hypothetical protein LLEC1_05742 [Akanthomyces lecanii]